MRVTFRCESCRSDLTVASHFAGRTILCPRCRQKTRIPAKSAAPDASAASDIAQSSGRPVNESANAFHKPAADFAPNPFAFSVRLETFVSANGDAEDDAPNAENAGSNTPSVNELIAELLDEENR